MATPPLQLLIVEDEEAHATALQRVFQDADPTVVIRVAGTLREYRSAVAAGPLDIAVMDLNLPDGRAVEVLQHPPEAGPFPILVMTSYGDERTAVEAIKAGALDYIVKSPESFADMPHAVDRTLREWRLLQEHRQAEQRLRDSLREKDILIKEVHHRVKNNLQVIVSLLRLQSTRIEHPAAKAALQDMQDRVRSMALLHETLYRSANLAEVDMANYFRDLCSQLCQSLETHSGAVRVQVDVAPLGVEVGQAIPCGLIVNELVSNCLKHGFPDGRSGLIHVELQEVDGGPAVRLRVADDGIGLPAGFDPTQTHTLGLKLVTGLVNQLEGRLTIGPGPGSEFQVVFTLTHGSP
jgi:two-component sensor histidine kinase